VKTSQVFGFPALGRTGLGNMLFPWARCYLWCTEYHKPMVAPIWTKFRLGPYLRQERDKRSYQILFRHEGYISGYNRLVILMLSRKISEQLIHNMPLNTSSLPKVVVFKGMADLFRPLMTQHTALLAELKRITRPWFVDTKIAHEPFIGIHIRRGDFSVPKDQKILNTGGINYQLPLGWYTDVLHEIRSRLGFIAKAYVFSDNSDEDLKELQSLPNIQIYRGGSAITDLLALSEARAIIASGSTFSMWASFLGQTPSVWYPGQRRQLLLDGDDHGELEPEYDMNKTLPNEFLAIVGRRVQG
jgi:hypothetical protein